MADVESSHLPSGSTLLDYVARTGGSHVIKRVLVANNGIAAVKVIRSIRKWCYETLGNEREVSFRLSPVGFFISLTS
jgi:hypothetical protein